MKSNNLFTLKIPGQSSLFHRLVHEILGKFVDFYGFKDFATT